MIFCPPRTLITNYDSYRVTIPVPINSFLAAPYAVSSNRVDILKSCLLTLRYRTVVGTTLVSCLGTAMTTNRRRARVLSIAFLLSGKCVLARSRALIKHQWDNVVSHFLGRL